MNGLKLDIHSEEKAVEMFAQNILDAGNSYLIIQWKLHLFHPGQELIVPFLNYNKNLHQQLQRI